jgi:PPK2 family polyphosphate:nucleotide phosphotransferase
MPNPLKRHRVTGDSKLDLAAFDPKEMLLPDSDDDGVLKKVQVEIAAFQNALFAENRSSLLVVLQGMDTSGKDGAIIATFDKTHPQGVRVTPFKAPSTDEAAHEFLWRVHPHAPAKGMIAVFNRSHYEAVIAERVLGLADRKECKRRYAQIVDFERLLIEHGTTIVKCFLHISMDEQKKRLQSRIDEPEKHWKFNPNDLVERGRWGANLDAFTDAIRYTSTRLSPWWVVPSDSKPHRNLMVATLVRDALAKIDPKYPPLDPKYRTVVIE